MKYFLGLWMLLAITACQRGETSQHSETVLDSTGKPVSLADAPVITFDKDVYDFGVITEGESVTYEFSFKNTGKSPLIISNASATCGCTVPEYPTKPIKPGEEGVIKVVFNSLGKVGLQDKVVTLVSNANPNLSNVHVVGEVKQKKEGK